MGTAKHTELQDDGALVMGSPSIKSLVHKSSAAAYDPATVFKTSSVEQLETVTAITATGFRSSCLMVVGFAVPLAFLLRILVDQTTR